MEETRIKENEIESPKTIDNISCRLGMILPVHAREILKHAISWGAKSIVVAHNHPTGDPTPSPEDAAVTEQLRSAADIVSIPLKWHLVLGKDRHAVL